MTRSPSEVDAPFPLDHAFVVQLRREVVVSSAIIGRIEHIVSGRACRFESMAELVSFVERTLGGLELASGAEPGTTTGRDDES